jgi:hypothetical protein
MKIYFAHSANSEFERNYRLLKYKDTENLVAKISVLKEIENAGN